MTDSNDGYNVQEHPWYSPQFVIDAVNRISRIYGSNIENKGEFKLVREMFAASVALLGAYELDSSNRYFLQPNFQSTSPDVMAAKQTENENAPVLLEISQMEIVTMNDFSKTDDVTEFLKETKLSSKKSYDDKTLIICVVNKKIQIDRQKIFNDLRSISPKSTIYILGKLPGANDIWTLFSPWPQLTKFIIYGLHGTADKFQLPGCISLHRGFHKNISYTEPTPVTTTVQKIFGLKEELLEKYKTPNVK